MKRVYTCSELQEEIQLPLRKTARTVVRLLFDSHRRHSQHEGETLAWASPFGEV